MVNHEIGKLCEDKTIENTTENNSDVRRLDNFNRVKFLNEEDWNLIEAYLIGIILIA